ncbi:MAG TPA: PAS domain-containing protein, partial [Thermoanaerobaculia bacterium]
MSGPRILVLFGLLLLAAGVVIGLPSSLAPAAVVIAAAAVLVLFGAERSAPGSGSRSDPATSVRAAFGPAVDAMDEVAVYTLDRSGRIGYANRGARRLLDVDGRDVEGRSASEVPAAGTETPEMVEGLNEVFETG